MTTAWRVGVAERAKGPDDRAPRGTHRYINKTWKCSYCRKWHSREILVCPDLANQ